MWVGFTLLAKEPDSIISFFHYSGLETGEWHYHNCVAIVTTLRARRSRYRISPKTKKTVLHNVWTAPGAHPRLLFCVYPPYFPVTKQPDSPPRAEVKNEWSYTSTPLHANMARTEIKLTFIHWHRFAFFTLLDIAVDKFSFFSFRL